MTEYETAHVDIVYSCMLSGFFEIAVLRGIKPPRALLQRIQDFKYQTLNSDLVVVMSFSMIVSDLKVCIGELL